MAERRAEQRADSGRSSPGDHQLSDRSRKSEARPKGGLESPRQRVIRSTALCHSPNHIAPARSAYGNGPCSRADRAFGEKRADPISPPVVPGATPRTCGLAAQLVFPESHPSRVGALVEWCLRQGGQRSSPSSGRPASPPRGTQRRRKDQRRVGPAACPSRYAAQSFMSRRRRSNRSDRVSPPTCSGSRGRARLR